MTRHLYFLFLLPLFTFCNQNAGRETKVYEEVTSEYNLIPNTTYYLIRHAEKDRTNPNDQDPGLNNEGLERSQRWATYFEPINIDRIYVTGYLRTQQTVSVIASQKAITPISYNAHNLPIEKLLTETKGKNVLVVGHSNTIPKIANTLLEENRFKDMEDGDNSTLYIITLNGSDKKAETFTVE